MPISGKNFCKLLEKHGWVFYRTKGSHYIYKKPGIKESISVPVHNNEELGRGLLKHLMKIAEIKDLD